MDAIHKNTTFPLSHQLVDEYKAINVSVYRLVDEAERQCRKIRTGSIPWSPAYTKTCLLLDYWYNSQTYADRERTHV